MEKKKINAQGFYILEFMSKLELSGIQLSVYALIYSFSVGASGLFYGSHQYIANTLSVSTKTVQRALKALRERGLIEKIELDGRKGYRAVEQFYKEPPLTPSPEANTDAMLYESEKYDSQEYQDEYEDENGFVHSDLTDSFKANYERLHRHQRPKYEKLTFGNQGLVGLTREQYHALRKLVNQETLNIYITRYERMAIKKIEARRPMPKNEYAVIRNWIIEANSL